jgi:hypothetical protein
VTKIVTLHYSNIAKLLISLHILVGIDFALYYLHDFSFLLEARWLIDLCST